MTCSLLTTWGRDDLHPAVGVDARGSAGQTRILDWGDPIFDRLPEDDYRTDVGYLRHVHRRVQGTVRPVYALDDTQPASVTLTKGQGSCSQRLAVVEALARKQGIPTRVEGLILRGEFWYPRFRYLRPFVPDRVLLAWPSFHADGEWLDASRAFTDGCGSLPTRFSNSGEETLFDAAARTPIDWGGDGTPGCLDLSRFVRQSLGTFDSRDDLFDAYGQTLHRPARMVLEPILGRWSAS